MFEAINYLVTVVLIGIAISIIYPHGRWIWLHHGKYGYWGATTMRLKSAWHPIVIAIIICLLGLGLAFYAGVKQNDLNNTMISRLDSISQKLDKLISIEESK